MGKVFGEFIVFVIRSGFGTRGLPCGSQALAHYLFHGAHRQPLFQYFLVEAELVLGIFQTEDGARMPHVDVLVAQTELDFSRKTQKAQMVGDSGAFLAQALGKALLGESVFVDQLLEAESHLDRVEVLALYVLDEGHLGHFRV